MPQGTTMIAETAVHKETPLKYILFLNGVGVYAKLEYEQVYGSIKGRVLPALLDEALKMRPWALIATDGTSGSSGKVLALEAKRRGMESNLMMPERLYSERAYLVTDAGGRVNSVPGEIGEAQDAAAALAASNPNVVYTDQFGSQENVRVHQRTTAKEIAKQLPVGVRKVRFVAGCGTGGTLVGTATGLAQVGYEVEMIMARPVAPDGTFSKKVPGVVNRRSNFFPSEHVRAIDVPEQQALETAALLNRMGYPCGKSGGLNVAAALLSARWIPLRPGEVLTTVLPGHVDG